MKVSVTYTDIDDFVNSEDRLVAQAKSTGFCIGGNLEYYEVMLENGWESQPVGIRWRSTPDSMEKDS